MLLATDPAVTEQHEAVRTTVGWYDFTHRLVEVTGPDATAFLDWIYPNSISKARVGGARYTTMLNEDGIITDDVVVFRLEEDRYWVSTLYSYRLLKWLDAHKGDREVEYAEVTSDWRMYSVQGPRSRDLLNSFLAEGVDDMRFFTIRDNRIEGLPVKVARSGYSGEKVGYEIYVATDQREVVEAKLREHGKAFGAVEVTELDVKVFTLACERGFILMTDVGEANPFEVGLEGGIDWGKDFIGKAGLERAREGGVTRQLLGFTVDNRDALIHGGPHGNPVMRNGERVGRATKFTYSPVLGKNIGYALVESVKAAPGDAVTINGYDAVLTSRQIVPM